MSLQVWLPLNGNSTNQGLSARVMTGSPASWENGKIGKCATFSGSTSNVIYNNTTDFNYTDNFSFCMWIKHNYSSSAGVQYLFTNGRTDAGGYGYGIGITGDSAIVCRFGNRQISVNCPANEWHHIAVTVYGTSIKVYKDGTLYTTSTTDVLPTYSDGNGLGIGCFHFSSNIYPYYGSLNDFRIYNHCLSPKEVKEISKGLVCHYRLSGIGEGNLLKSTYTGCTGGNGTITENGFNGFSYRYLKYEGTSYSDTISVGNFVTPTTDTKYTVSFWAKGTCSIRCFFYPSACSSGVSSVGTTTTVSDGRINIPLTNEWKKYWITWTTPSSVSGSKHIVLGRIENQGTGAECYIAGVKFEKGPRPTPWCPNSEDTIYSLLGYDSTSEPDCSGYGNNGTKYGNITWNYDTRRYDGSYSFNNSGYLTFPNPINSSNTEFTISCWVRYDTIDGNSTICTMRSVAGKGIALFRIGNNFRFDDGNQITFTNYTIVIGEWIHVTITRTQSDKKLYINGELKQYTSTVGDMSNISTIGSIAASSQDGSGFNNYTQGQLSDLRIYATALSEEDVKSLYNVAASIDKSGTLMTYEFEEE